MTGCTANNNYNQLDRNKIETETTTVSERYDYYKTAVDDLVDNMTDEELDEYYVTVNITYVDRESYYGDNLIFFKE